MKRTSLAAACLLGLASFAHAQTGTVSLKITAGLLENSAGTAVEPDGGLLQLIASPSGTFSPPTSSSYVSGDNTVVESFAMNSNGGTSGLSVNALNSLALSSNFTSGESLLLRFYPSLTAAGMPAAPTLGTTFGEVRSSTTEFGPTVDPSETAWFVPSGGSTVDLDYVTSSAGGTYANDSAYATDIVGATVPEPSTGVLFGCGLLGLIGLRFRRPSARA